MFDQVQEISQHERVARVDFLLEHRLGIHDGLVSLACVLICWRRLINWTR